MPSDPQPVMVFESTEAWEAWLAAHHADSPGLWLKIAKKGSAGQSISYSDALDVALCYGWIDGQKGRHDDDYWLQRFTPRKPGGNWSKINTERAAALIASSRMRPAGLREIEQAQADGRWERAYQSQSRITVPEDLARALEANPRAREFFATLDGTNRYAVLYRITSAKRPETRAKRIDKFVAMLSEHKKIHP
ncbi:MAG TPA: YdeI/OmpD-associated family protein [Streptosporangiaceae bacterium]|nr:YdeI/OmpD-associated family protein [Streptosporangiaceae bacterium]